MEPKPLSRAARQQCTAPSAAANSDGMQPTDSASAVSDPHGSSGGGAGEKKQRLAVFVSGGGSNMRAIHAATLDGRLPASVEVRFSCWPTLARMYLRSAHLCTSSHSHIVGHSKRHQARAPWR